MLELENNELRGLKLQHDQKVNELQKTQAAVLEVSASCAANCAFCGSRKSDTEADPTSCLLLAAFSSSLGTLSVEDREKKGLVDILGTTRKVVTFLYHPSILQPLKWPFMDWGGGE